MRFGQRFESVMPNPRLMEAEPNDPAFLARLASGTVGFRLTPTNIRRTLKLNRPIYRRTASYGHFGRAPEKDGGFSWEKTDLVSALKGAF